MLVVGWRTHVTGLKGREAGLAQLLSREVAAAVDRARHHRGLERAAHLEVLTNLPNRRAWEQRLPAALDDAALEGRPVAVALLDFNAFKALNDSAGHPAGDRLLRACGEVWRETLRPTDTLARLGGDEFAVLLPNCDAEQAAGVSRLLRVATPHEQGVAVGVAQWDGTEHPGALLARADAALYADKANVRTRRLGDAERLRAVAAAVAAADTRTLDDLTAITSELLDAPVVLVSLVDDHQQLLPGQCGLAEPWATERRTPLSHSFCQHVVTSSAPLVVEDARHHPLVRHNLAIGDLNVIAYAGAPLIDGEGHTIGALCAIDGQPRQWKPEDLAELEGLAPTVARRLGRVRATAELEPVRAG